MNIRNVGLILVILFLSGFRPVVLEDTVKSPPESQRLTAIPARPADAMGGREFARMTSKMSPISRQRAALAELRRGNIPEFLRNLKPVRIHGETASGDTVTAMIWVTPDYLAIGSEEDFLRIPLSFPSATAIARESGCVLPTRKIVDAVNEQAVIHLKPAPLPPGPKMRSSEYYLRHNDIIEKQIEDYPRGELVSGHKKDVVISNLLNRKPDRVAIYGWHDKEGNPIQPLSTVHGSRYADYSHGVRLVSQTVWINGTMRSIYDVLGNPELAPVLTYEGKIANARDLIRGRR